MSARGEYGVRSMIFLALKHQDGFIPLSRIASEEGISRHFLEQIFADLRREGLITSARGVKGGYALAHAPSKICVGDIIRALEGPITPVDCLSSEEGDGRGCHRGKIIDHCLAHRVWRKLQDHINQLLDNITLQDMLNWKY